MRSGSGDHFQTEDLFLPTFINRALKVEGIVKKLFLSILAIVLDILTFPCRMVSLILDYKDYLNEHPLVQLVKQTENVGIKNGVYRIEVEYDETEVEGEKPLLVAHQTYAKGFCEVSTDGFDKITKAEEFRQLYVRKVTYKQDQENWKETGKSAGICDFNYNY